MLIPDYPDSHYFERPLQAGIGYISEILLHHGIENIAVDMRFNHSVKSLNNKITAFKPDLIGVSMMTFKYLHTYNFLWQIKQTFPDIPIVVGGAHLSTLREKVLEECEAVDFGIVLEGEETILELCEGIEPDKIKGLIYREDGKAIYTGDRPFLKDLDSIPFPRYSRFDLQNYDNFIPVVSSRGCPYKCSYCPVQLAIGKHFRFRSAKNIVEEIEFWYRKGCRSFGFADDNFTLRPERVSQFCDEIEIRRFNGIRLSCSNGIRADRVNREILARMKEVGFYQLSFGVEAGNDTILRNLHKGEKIDTIKKAISDACDLGYEVGLFFLLGSPGESWKDVQDSIDLALSYPVTYAPFYNLIPFPNTELFRWVEERGYFLIKPEVYLNEASHFINEPVFETPELPYEERKKAWEYANKIVGKHCKDNKRKFVKSKFNQKLKFPDFLNEICSHLWCTNFVQNRFLQSKTIRNVRDKIMKR